MDSFPKACTFIHFMPLQSYVSKCTRITITIVVWPFNENVFTHNHIMWVTLERLSTICQSSHKIFNYHGQQIWKKKKKKPTMLLHAHVNDLSHGFGRFVGKSRFSFLSSVHVFISYFRLFIFLFIKHILQLLM